MCNCNVICNLCNIYVRIYSIYTYYDISTKTLQENDGEMPFAYPAALQCNFLPSGFQILGTCLSWRLLRPPPTVLVSPATTMRVIDTLPPGTMTAPPLGAMPSATVSRFETNREAFGVMVVGVVGYHIAQKLGGIRNWCKSTQRSLGSEGFFGQSWG